MFKVVGWGLTICAVVLLIWQLVVSSPLLPSAVSALLLMLFSVLAGLRIGVDGTADYVRDVQRLNKVLAEQHHELEELNSNLLQQLAAQEKERAAEQKLP